MKRPSRGQLVLWLCVPSAALVWGFTVWGCHSGERLVEVFDNGPVGGPGGGSEGYRWVGTEEMPPPGKSWKPVQEESLSAAERKRIH